MSCFYYQEQIKYTFNYNYITKHNKRKIKTNKVTSYY